MKYSIPPIFVGEDDEREEADVSHCFTVLYGALVQGGECKLEDINVEYVDGVVSVSVSFSVWCREVSQRLYHGFVLGETRYDKTATIGIYSGLKETLNLLEGYTGIECWDWKAEATHYKGVGEYADVFTITIQHNEGGPSLRAGTDAYLCEMMDKERELERMRADISAGASSSGFSGEEDPF